MGRKLLYALLFVAIGAAVGVYVAGGDPQRPSLGAGRRAPSGQGASSLPAATGTGREVAELQKRVEALTAKLVSETAGRQRLEERLEALEAHLASQVAPAGGSSSSATASAPLQQAAPSSEAISAEEGTSPMERALVAAGIDERTAADIKRRGDELMLSEMFLRDQAAREKWTDSPQFKEEMEEIERQRVSIRDEIGDESYDRYLAALGEPNRVTVDEVMTDSPAALAGLQPGDIVLRYGDTRIFAPGELVAETRGGTAGESVNLQILRGGQSIVVAVPRGPLGLRIAAGRADPG